MGNCKSLIRMRIDAGDKLLEDHLKKPPRMPHTHKKQLKMIFYSVKK